jgi:hypothetical protein
MSDDKKPREFWLGNEYVDVKGHGKYYSWKRVNPEHPSDVHVIEHSAYAALQKENEELQEFNKLLVDEIKAMKHPEYDPHKHEKEIEELRADRNRLDQDFGEMGERAYKAEQENASLRESLKLAVEALELSERRSKIPQIRNAIGADPFLDVQIEVLAKITAKHTELD